ncbi:MAG: hypothetical protein V4662_01120 [Verrucomicrobiota bacterium]
MPDASHCPICQELLVEVEAGLNREIANAILTGFGSSELQIRLPDGGWKTYMTPERDANGLLCTSCGSLTLAPTIAGHRKSLGLNP